MVPSSKSLFDNGEDDSLIKIESEGEYIRIISEEKHLDESEAVYEGKYQNYLASAEDVKRLARAEKALGTALSKYCVAPHQSVSEEKIKGFARIIRQASDERVIQRFLSSNPFFLTRKIHPAYHDQVCISKPKLGCQYEPDFLIAGQDSGGLWWYGVELESPKAAMFTRGGENTQKLSHAVRQIENWRGWLQTNISYARDTMGYTDIDSDLPCYIIIGRRENEVLDEDKLHQRRREVQKRDKCGLFLHHYEWLLDDQPTRVAME